MWTVGARLKPLTLQSLDDWATAALLVLKSKVHTFLDKIPISRSLRDPEEWMCGLATLFPTQCPVIVAALIKCQATAAAAATHLPLTYPTFPAACPSQPSQSESSPLMTLRAGLRSPWQPAEAREERWLGGKSNVGQHKRGIFLKNLSDPSLELIHHLPGCCLWLQAGSWLKRAHEREVRPTPRPRWQECSGKGEKSSFSEEFSQFCNLLLWGFFGFVFFYINHIRGL